MSSRKRLEAQIRALLARRRPPRSPRCRICRESGALLSRGYCPKCSPLDAIYGDLTPGSY